MIQLTEEEKQFKLPFIGEGSKNFFNTQPAVEWDVETYFEASTNAKKQKKIRNILTEYLNDLNWISRHEGVPARIKEYAQELISAKKPTPALLKANVARKACKKRKLNSLPAIINHGSQVNIINNSSINGTVIAGGSPEPSTVPPQTDASAQNQVSSASVWKDWITYANSSLDQFHPFSLIANDIVRADEDNNLYPIPETFKAYITAFTAAQDDASRERIVNSMSMILFEKKDASFEFLRNILGEIRQTYMSQIDFNSSEDAWNQLFIWPHLISMARSITASNTSPAKSEFMTGQPILHSMTRQMKAVDLYIDDKNVYKSDGVMTLFGLKKQEILLLETSGCFTNLDKAKVNFDHHKGVYGLLSMIKCIADDYCFGSLDTFMKIKTYFLHAADERLHLWSVCYHNEGAFDLWREVSVHILPDEADKVIHVPRLVQFLWTTKCLVEESVRNIIALKQQHEANSAEHAFSLDEQQSLRDIVNPIILKLTKEDDHHGMATLGPMYSPSHQ